MIKTETGAQYQEKEDCCFQHNSMFDKDFTDVKISQVKSFGNIHFIYLESLDKHVKKNLGPIVYTGDLQFGITQGTFAKYSYDGDKLIFSGWILTRTQDGWVCDVNPNVALPNSKITPVLPNPEFVPFPEYHVEQEIVAPKRLNPVFQFYLDSVRLLYDVKERQTPIYKRENVIKRHMEYYKKTRKYLLLTQMIIQKGVTDVFSLRLNNIDAEACAVGIKQSYGYLSFVKRMIVAWNEDKKSGVIDDKGVFLCAKESAILSVKCIDVVPSGDSEIYNRLAFCVKGKVIKNAMGAFNNAVVIKKRRGRPPKVRQ